MKTKTIKKFLTVKIVTTWVAVILLPDFLFSQNIGVNTTGAPPASGNMFEVLQPSTTASSVGIYVNHSGAITGYALQAIKAGAGVDNIAAYLSASGGTNNYALLVPGGGGSVGIGTTTPTTLLNIVGAHSTTQFRLTLPAASNGGGTGDVNLQLWASEPGITWDAGGIGTNVSNNNGSPAGFGRLNTSLGQSYIRFITNGGSMAFNTADNAGTYYQTMYMNSGNVGVGTTSPGEALSVFKPLGGWQGRFSNNSGTGADVYLSHGSGYGMHIRGWNASDGIYTLEMYNNSTLTNAFYNSGRVVLGMVGNVGVGTTGPSAKLQVLGGSQTVPSIRTDGYVEDVSGIMNGNYITSRNWTVGSGTTGIFNENGAGDNVREWGDGPHGNRVLLWKAQGASGADDGGWNTNTFNIDNTKTYRVSVWIKRTGTTDGTTYVGIQGSNIIYLTGAGEGNPYFWCGDLPVFDRWYLVVGFIHGSGDASTSNKGGIYDGVTGLKVVSFGGGGNCDADFKFTSSATTQQQRAYLYYNSTGSNRQYFWDPRFEEVNGREIPISSLLAIDITTASSSTGYIQNQFSGAQSANHWVSGNSRAGEVYSGNWFRNDAANTGLYNQTTGAGIYSPSSGLMSTYNSSSLQIEGASNGSGNLRFSAANPYIVSSSYFVCPGGAYFNSGTVYTEAQYQCRGGIHNDNSSYLTIAGGTSAFSYFSGNVGIATTAPAEKLQVVGKTTLSRDNAGECCSSGNYTLALSESTSGSGNKSTIQFHNGGFDEGGIQLTSGSMGVGGNSRRFRMFDNQGVTMGLELTGKLYFGNSGTKTETRDDAGLQGSSGAQSGMFETSSPTNYPSGASSWWHLLDVRHSNNGNNYAMQFAGSFFDQNVYVRKTNNNASQAWEKILTTGTSVDLANVYFLYSTANLCINGGWAGFPGMSQALNLLAGDKVMVWASGGSMIDSDCNGFSNATNGTYNVRVSVNGSDFPNGAWGRYGLDYGSAWIAFTSWSISGMYDVPSNGSYTFSTEGSLYSGNSVLAGGDNTSALQATMIVFVYRD